MIIEKITLGGGCFWCIENIFNRVNGIVTVTSGYAAGDIINPSYEEICRGTTNHAEVVDIEFDPEVVNLETILTVFFGIHDPTTLNRQGNDVGSHYRSIILVRNDQQQAVAQKKIAELNNADYLEDKSENKIVTEIKQFEQFYSAESYHQGYVEDNPDSQYCQLVVAQKIQKFLANFSHLLKDEKETI
ncbi:MAG: peptide-methionine (S)-S-oxide reductase [Gammaproteobacteria bacterium]|nr:MAG: peptide-methionine (S)-S-oxide reductase [Gammaproteobacteria bacterium]